MVEAAIILHLDEVHIMHGVGRRPDSGRLEIRQREEWPAPDGFPRQWDEPHPAAGGGPITWAEAWEVADLGSLTPMLSPSPRRALIRASGSRGSTTWCTDGAGLQGRRPQGLDWKGRPFRRLPRSAADVCVALVGDPRQGGAGRGLGNLVPRDRDCEASPLPSEEEMAALDSELEGLYGRFTPGTLQSKSARPNPPRYGSSRGEGFPPIPLSTPMRGPDAPDATTGVFAMARTTTSNSPGGQGGEIRSCMARHPDRRDRNPCERHRGSRGPPRARDSRRRLNKPGVHSPGWLRQGTR